MVGLHCLQYLLEDQSYTNILVLTRRSLQIRHPKLKEKIIDFNNLATYSNLIDLDDIFCCLGTTIKQAGTKEAFKRVDFQYPLELAKIAAHNNSRQFLLISSLGANSSSKIFYSRVKGEIEEAISNKNFYGVQIFRPSMLLGHRERVRKLEQFGKLFMQILSPFFVGSLKKYKPIEAKSVAKVMLEIAKCDIKDVQIYESDQIQFLWNRLVKS